MKTAITILAATAAVAGIVYLLKDNDAVKDTLNSAKDTASGSWDKVKGGFFNAKGEVSNQMAELR